MSGSLLDSNLIIYGAQPNGENVRRFIESNTPFVSVVSKIETLGYHALTDNERERLEAFFAAATVLPISEDVVAGAIELRQQRSISLGDSIIAATALASDLTLATHNISDFDWIAELRLVDPIRDERSEGAA